MLITRRLINKVKQPNWRKWTISILIGFVTPVFSLPYLPLPDHLCSASEARVEEWYKTARARMGKAARLPNSAPAPVPGPPNCLTATQAGYVATHPKEYVGDVAFFWAVVSLIVTLLVSCFVWPIIDCLQQDARLGWEIVRYSAWWNRLGKRAK